MNLIAIWFSIGSGSPLLEARPGSIFVPLAGCAASLGYAPADGGDRSGADERARQRRRRRGGDRRDGHLGPGPPPVAPGRLRVVRHRARGGARRGRRRDRRGGAGPRGVSLGATAHEWGAWVRGGDAGGGRGAGER